MTASQLFLLDDVTPERPTLTYGGVDGKTFFLLGSNVLSRLIDQSAARKDAISPPPLPQSCPAIGRFSWRVRHSKAITGSEAGWSTYRSNEALFCQTSGLRDTEVSFTLYSTSSQSSSVQLSPVVLQSIGSVFVQLITRQSSLL